MMKMMNKINAMMAKTSIIMKVLLIILNGLYITNINNINIQKQMKKFFPLKVWYKQDVGYSGQKYNTINRSCFFMSYYEYFRLVLD